MAESHEHQRGGMNENGGAQVAGPDWSYLCMKSIDELIAERGRRPLQHEEIAEKWAGVIEPEFWDEVLRVVDAR